MIVTVLEDLSKQLSENRGLSNDEVAKAVDILIGDTVPVETKADFLIHLGNKGESVDEIAAFARELSARSIPIPHREDLGEILDVCGTGGDRLNTFNISTATALLLATAGLTVAKHGNRAITSQTGSADVLEALGIPINLTPSEAADRLKKDHFAFLLAPQYHPAFRHIIPARKLCAERGQRTIFNFLGPLLNPARPNAQLIGVARPEICERVARVLQSLGIIRGMVVCGHTPEGFLDEFSILGETRVSEFYQERGFNNCSVAACDFPVQTALLSDLRGGNPVENADIIRRIFSGHDRGPKRDAVLLNTAAGLFVGGKIRSLTEGWELAASLIDSGLAAAKIQSLGQRSN